MNLKRGLAFVIIFSMLFSMMTFAEEKTDQEIAEALGQAKLIAGDGSGYNLTGSVTRAEAATFIVKLLGDEKHVTDLKAMYTKSNFPDIKGDEWYAPYIGYCERNYIISGYPDKTVKANNTLSEKAFLTMVLKALGYTSSDFTWDTVYKFSYDVGLVTDSSYATRTEDRMVYPRSSVVNVMYNSLNLVKNNSDSTLVQGLIEKKVVAEDQAKSLGLYKVDELKTLITSAKSTDMRTVKVTLNEEIQSLSSDQIEVTAGSGTIEVSSVSLSGKDITLTVDSDLSGKMFKVTLKNVKDTLGFKVASLEKDFSPYKLPEIVSSYFKISKVEPVSKNRVDVYFTHPINISAGLVSYYDIYRDGKLLVEGDYNKMAINVRGDVDNAISIWLKNESFEENTPYQVKISGNMTSAYDTKINGGENTSFDFFGKHEENEKLKVTNLRQLSTNMLELTFNKDLNKAEATNITNYEFKNTSSNIDLAVVGASIPGSGSDKNRIVLLRTLQMEKDKNYELKIKSVKDAFSASTITDEIYPLTGGDFNTSNLSIEYVAPMSSYQLQVYFDRPLSSDSTSAIITGVSVNKIVYDPNVKNALTIYLNSGSKLVNGQEYNLQIVSGLKDTTGQSQSGIVSKKFNGVEADQPTIQMTDARFVDSKKVKVNFTVPVSGTTSASAFKLKWKDGTTDKTSTATGISFYNSTTALLTFNDSPDGEIAIEATNLYDPSNQFVTSSTSMIVVKE